MRMQGWMTRQGSLEEKQEGESGVEPVSRYSGAEDL